MSEYEPPRRDSALGKVTMIWAIIALGLFFFVGLGFSLIWICALGVYFAFRSGVFWGVLAGAAYAVVFFGLPLIDGQVFQHQLAKARANDISAAPVDLTGKTVLFVGSSTRYHPVACSNLCQTLVLNGTAKAVYFGQGTSTQYS